MNEYIVAIFKTNGVETKVFFGNNEEEVLNNSDVISFINNNEFSLELNR